MSQHDTTGNALLRQKHGKRPQAWQGQRAEDVLAQYPIGKAKPMLVLETLIRLFNHQHLLKNKDVSFKTQKERAAYLRRFMKDLRDKAGFRTLPDPRNLGERHFKATMLLWQQEQLQAPTVQTYLSFLRSLCSWIKKPGLVRTAEDYGLAPEQYQRTGAAQYDHSWSAQDIDIDALIVQVDEYDPKIGAALKLVRTLGLRRKEAMMFNPFEDIVTFAATGLPLKRQRADAYAKVNRGTKGGRVRYIPLEQTSQLAAIEYAKQQSSAEGHLGREGDSLEQSLNRYSNVLRRFGISEKGLGVTGHGLRHEVLIDTFEQLAGHPAPVRGGDNLKNEADHLARQLVAENAGHSRKRASNAYLGGINKRQTDITTQVNFSTVSVEKDPHSAPQPLLMP